MTENATGHLRLVKSETISARPAIREPFVMPTEPEPGAVALAEIERQIGGARLSSRIGLALAALSVGAATTLYLLGRVVDEPAGALLRAAAIAVAAVAAVICVPVLATTLKGKARRQ